MTAGLRVLHVGKFYPPHRGGIEVFLADLVHAQRAQGIEAFALVHGQAQAGDPAWLVRVPVQVQLVYAPLALGFRSALRRAIERFQPQVLHLHMPNNAVFWALTLATARDIPWVVHWHADVVVSRIRTALALAYKVYRPFEQAVLERADRIIATSPPYLQASEPLASWRDKCAVVPLGLRAGSAACTNSGCEDNRPPWREGGERRLRLLSIGRLTYYKGFETLIRAVATLPDVELVIAGAGELQPMLQALVRSTTRAGCEPQVLLMREVSEADKRMLLRTCDVFCLASRERTEAFGLVLLEAMRAARPCLVSKLHGSGMPWLVQQSNSGWLVETENVRAWQAAIAHCASHPAERAEKGAAGQRAFASRFTVDACAVEIEAQYRSLLGAMSPAALCRDVLVVIPARDEIQTIGGVVAALRNAGWNDVLVVDDHSSDGTALAAWNAGARVLQPVLRMGAWGGIQAGLRHGLAQGYQGVVTMDADGQHDVGSIPALLSRRDEADLVIGAFPERASRQRRIAWHWFRQLAGFDLRDLTSGFRYYNLSAMQILSIEEATLLDYQDLGILLLARKAGLRITEVPVEMSLRVSGKSRIFNSWISVGRYLALTTLLCLARWQVSARRATGTTP